MSNLSNLTAERDQAIKSVEDQLKAAIETADEVRTQRIAQVEAALPPVIAEFGKIFTEAQTAAAKERDEVLKAAAQERDGFINPNRTALNTVKAEARTVYEQAVSESYSLPYSEQAPAQSAAKKVYDEAVAVANRKYNPIIEAANAAYGYAETDAKNAYAEAIKAATTEHDEAVDPIKRERVTSILAAERAYQREVKAAKEQHDAEIESITRWYREALAAA